VSKVFVGNLDFSTTRQNLEGLFSQHGEIVDVAIPVDRESGKPRGFAFVTFGSTESANAAIRNLDGADLLGRRLRVSEATPGRSAGGGGGNSRGFSRAPDPSPEMDFRPTAFTRPKGSRRGLRGRKRSL
jgi:RNA recognition motif-containing protein